MIAKNLIFLFVLLTLSLFQPKDVRAQGVFNCEWTGLECHTNVSTATCVPGYQTDDAVCNGYIDMGSCQGAINNECVVIEPPEETLCYACVNNACTLVNPNNYGGCPFRYSPEGLYGCELSCSPLASITPPPNVTPVTEPKYSCKYGTCELDPNGEFTGQQCEAECVWASTNKCGGVCRQTLNFCNSGEIPTGFCDSISSICCEDILNFAGGDSMKGPEPTSCGSGGEGFQTAIGCIPVGSSDGFAIFILRLGVGIIGGIALALMGSAGYMMTTSSGDPKKVQAAKELLTAALMGVILILFGVFAIRFIGIDILSLNLFGFGG